MNALKPTCVVIDWSNSRYASNHVKHQHNPVNLDTPDKAKPQPSLTAAHDDEWLLSREYLLPSAAGGIVISGPGIEPRQVHGRDEAHLCERLATSRVPIYTHIDWSNSPYASNHVKHQHNPDNFDMPDKANP